MANPNIIEAEMKWTTDYETWYKTWCPYCEAPNFHCNGNESDLSGIDVDAVRCWKCQRVYLLGPPDKILIEMNEGRLYDNEVDGRESAQ